MLDKLKALTRQLNPVQRALEATQGLPSLTPVAAMEFIAGWLPQQQNLLEQPTRMQEALWGLDPLCRERLAAAASELMRGQLTRLRLQLYANAAQPYVQALYRAYLPCVQQYKLSLVQKPHEQFPPHAGFLFWGTRRLVMEFITTRQAQQTQWQELYAAIPAILGEKLPASALPAARLALAQFCLVSSGLAAELEVRQVDIVDRLVGMLAPFVSFSQQPRSGIQYWLDIHQPHPPALVDLGKLPQPSNGLIYIQFERVLDELLSLETLIAQQAQLPTKLNFDGNLHRTEVLVTLRQLRDKWMGKVATRRHERKLMDKFVFLALDLPAIRRKVAGFEQAGTRTINLGIERARMEDISQSGIGLRVPAEAWAKVGLAVGIQVEGNPRWVVGVVRRLVNTQTASELHMGVEILSLTPQSIRLVEEARLTVWEQTNAGGALDNVFGVWIPPSVHSHEQAMLLLEKPEVVIGKSYGMYYHGHKGMIRIKDQVEVGDNFYRYTVDVVEALSASVEKAQELDF